MANLDWGDKLDRIRYGTDPITNPNSRLSVGRNSAILLDGEEIPYAFLPKAFEVLSESSRYTKEGGVTKTVYSLNVGHVPFKFHKYSNGDFHYTLNDVLHCSSGPAVKSGERREFYNNGALHNANGPAIIEGAAERYYLDGKEIALSKLIEKSPLSEHSWGCRGTHSYYISKLNGYAIIRGLDGTVALLKKSDEPASVDDFLLEVIGTRIPGYRVILYEHIGLKLSPIYKYLSKDRAAWKVAFYNSVSKLTHSSPDGSRAVLSLSKDSHRLIFKIKTPSGIRREWVVNYGFDDFFTSNDSPTFPSIEVMRDDLGKLSATSGPAIRIEAVGQEPAVEEFYIDGLELSADEFSHFDSTQNAVVFKDANGRNHRTDGPAIIDFNIKSAPTQYWFENGNLISGPESTQSSKIINSAGTTMPTYTDINIMQSKFEEALKRVAKKANAAKDKTGNLGGDGMDIKTVKHGVASANTSDSRIKQVTSGAKLGLQKAALRIGTKKVAEKIVDAASPTDNVVIQRIVQLALLLGTAELAERLPDGAASKVGFTEDRREGYGGLARYVAGETLGRDAIDIVGFVAPMLLDKLQGISAEEIAELTADAEEVERLEVATLATTK